MFSLVRPVRLGGPNIRFQCPRTEEGCTECRSIPVAGSQPSTYIRPVSASLPFIPPCRPRPVRLPPKGEAWLHEPKLDGWRMQAVKRGSDVALYSRQGRELSERFASIAEAVRKLTCRSCTLDGEVVRADSAGGVDFYGLTGKRDGVSFWAFDLLERDGKDLKPLPLAQRKAQLAKVMARIDSQVLGLVPSFDDGEALLIACMDKGVEGIVSKRRDQPYRSGSRPEWVKVKCPGWTAANRERWRRFERA